MSDARAAVLGRIRAATGDVPADEAPVWTPQPASEDGVGFELAQRFDERLRDYGAEVMRVSEGGIGGAVAAALRRLGADSCAVPLGLPDDLVPPGIEVARDDPPLSPRALERIGAAVTGCALAIAETGTIVLTGSQSGRRALTLLPDLHVCVVRAEQLVADVPDAIATLADQALPIVFVSGPSATSDIELERVEGVHGPRHLAIVLVDSTVTKQH